jgi:hypothetical protein
VLRARLRSSFRLPLATSTSRSSLPAASQEIIPPSLMGHEEHDADQANGEEICVKCRIVTR